jgi:ribonuclease D
MTRRFVARFPRLIERQSDFSTLCDAIRDAGEVAFDTEFVSEFTYRPELCLLQFATPTVAAAVDPLAVDDLSEWWSIMTGGQVLVVVHGGREEVRFCLRYGESRPGRLVDVQIAEGLQSRSFPLGYTALVQRVLGVRTEGRETRTDWRRRPLTDSQLHYALEDVEHQLRIWSRQKESLGARGRLEWVHAECARAIDDIEREHAGDNWRRLSGLSGLSARELAIVRELYRWRESESQARNRPARKTLRDDLLIELARRKPKDVSDLMAVRDMNRTDYRRSAMVMIRCIERALAMPTPELPFMMKRHDKDQDEQLIAQLLGIALSNRCAQTDVSMGLVGNSADLKHLVRWHVYGDREETPRLMQGWRAEICGDLLGRVLDGKIALRVNDPQSDHPLVFEPWDKRSASG